MVKPEIKEINEIKEIVNKDKAHMEAKYTLARASFMAVNEWTLVSVKQGVKTIGTYYKELHLIILQCIQLKVLLWYNFLVFIF